MASSKNDAEKNTTKQREPMKSKKLDRTLHELENAFTQWESISKAPPAKVTEAARQKAAAAEQNEEEFRKKTKKLLNQLRQQLAELND